LSRFASYRVVASVTLCMAIVAMSFAAVGPAGAASTTTAGSGKNIAANVWVIGDFTSTIAFTVPETLAAVQGALKDYKKVKISSCDSKGEQNSANECSRKAVSDGADVVVSTYGSLGQDHAILNQAGIPVIGLTDNKAPNAFGMSSAGSAAANVGTGAVAAKCKKVGTLYLDGADVIADGVTQSVKAAGGKVSTSVAVPLNAPDLAPAIARLLDAGSDCIAVIVTPNIAVQAVTAISQSGKKPRMISLSAIFNKDTLDTLGSLADGILIADGQRNPTDKIPVMREITRDMQKYDKSAELTTNAVLAWCDGKIIAAALDSLKGEATAASMLTAMNGLRDVDLKDAIHSFSAIPLVNPAFVRFFNHYGINYVIKGGKAKAQGTWYDVQKALESLS